MRLDVLPPRRTLAEIKLRKSRRKVARGLKAYLSYVEIPLAADNEESKTPP